MSLRALTLVLASLAAGAGARAADAARAEKLILDHTWVEMDLLEGTEVLDLLARPPVRNGLRKRIRDLLQDPETNGGRAGRIYKALAASGATAEDVQLLAADFRSRLPDGFDSLAVFLLERAPLSLSPTIEKLLLGPLAREAASSLSADSANCIWLLAHRLPFQSVQDVAKRAWQESAPLDRRSSDARLVYAEILVQGPDGKPLPEMSWTETLGSWIPSHSVIWPDSKARFRCYLDKEKDEQALQVSLAVPGYQNPPRGPLTLKKGSVAKHTVALGARRARIRGRLSPAPARPVFARHEGGVPLGRGPSVYRRTRGEMTVPVRADGAFEAPASSRGKKLLIHDIDGNVFLAVDAAPGDGGGDVDLGELKLPASSGLVAVPILLQWPASVAAGDAFQANVSWIPDGAGQPRGSTHCYLSNVRAALEGKPIRFGIARNMEPGTYSVKARFNRERDQGEVSEVEMPFVVADAKSPLVLKPGKKTGAPDPTPAEPTGALTPVAWGSRFELKSGPSGGLHLLIAGSDEVTLRTREAGTFGPPRPLYKLPKGPERFFGRIDFLVASDESFHAFLQITEGELHEKLHYARVPREKEKRHRWVPIADGNAPNDTYDRFFVYPRRKDVCEVFAQAESIRLDKDGSGSGTIQNVRILNGLVQNGQYRHVRSIRIDNGPFAGLFGAHFFAEPEGDPQALFSNGREGQEQLLWTGLKRYQPKPAAALPRNARFHEVKSLVTPQGIVYVVAPVQVEEKPARYQFWVARGRPGQPLEARGLIDEKLPVDGFSLTAAPDGSVYLVSGLLAEDREKNHIALWKLSGEFPPAPIPTPWLAEFSDDPPRAAFAEPGKADVAWERSGAIHVETFTLPER